MKAEDTVISDDDIDGTRFHLLDELEKKAKVNWWDICKAVKETMGQQASLAAEQFLIDITNKTGQEVAKAQAEISFKAGIKEVVEWITNREKYYTNPHLKYDNEWQSKLKDWGY